MRKILSVVAGLLAITVLAAPSSARTLRPRVDAPSKVYVVHGLKLDSAGTKVDVFAGAAGAPIGDAGQLINDFLYRTVVGPVSLPPASYTVYVAKPTASNDGKLQADEVLFSKTLAVPSGKNLSAVASLDAAGQPTINVFVNDVSAVPAGGSRLSIRHAAAAPAVKADVGFLPYSRSYSFFVNTYGPAENGQQADITTASGKYDVVVRVAANGARVSAVGGLPVSAKMLTAVYAVGTPGSTFSFIVQRIAL